MIHFNDDWMAVELLRRQGAYLRYSPALGWLTFQKNTWHPDEPSAFQLYREMLRTMLDEEQPYLRVAATAEQRAFLRNYNTFLNGAHARSVMEFASKDPAVQIDPDSFDPNPWFLNTPTCILDLRSGVEFSGPHPDQLCTMSTNTTPRSLNVENAPDPTMKDWIAPLAPHWHSFITTICDGDSDTVKTLQQALGSALAGSNPERLCFILWGTGANGKSVLLETVSWILGSYATAVHPDTIASRDHGQHNDLADLVGKRFACASESDSSATLNEALLKSVTGGDLVRARRLYHQWFSFRPRFKLFLATNEKPRIRSGGDAIWQRLRLLPFAVSIPPERQIPFDVLLDRFKIEADWILAWLVQGCLAWQYHKCHAFMSEAVTAATHDYHLSEDLVGQFLSDATRDFRFAGDASERRAQAGPLYDAYSSWCEKSGHKRCASNTFSERVRNKGYLKHVINGRCFWYGMEMTSEGYSMAHRCTPEFL